MNNSWQHFSVGDFFGQNNWSGTSLESSDSVLQEIPWLCQKIEDFFSQSNWQGKLLSEMGQPEFSLTLSVAGFFQFFDWESGAKSGFITKLEPLPKTNAAPNDEFKLDDFGNLF